MTFPFLQNFLDTTIAQIKTQSRRGRFSTTRCAPSFAKGFAGQESRSEQAELDLLKLPAC